MDFTLSEYIDALLNRRYAADTKGMMKALRQMSESAEVQQALEALENHVAGLTGNTLVMTDPELSKALAVIQKEMNFAQGLITNVAPNLAESGAEIANRAATAKLFGNVTDNLILQNVNPLEASIYKRFLELAAERNIPFSAPDPAVMANKFVTSQAWIDRMDKWGDGYSALFRDRIKQGIDEGWSPIRVAREIRQYATTMPRYAAENIARTTQLYSYREATAEIENRMGKFIERKIRIAALDMRTCPACIALHGTEIPLGQAVEDHYNGRCDAIYIPPGGEMPSYMQSMSTPGNRNFVPFQNGEDWFTGLSESQQRSILGPGKFEIYKSGTPLSEFWHNHEDSVFGMMPGVKPLWMMEGYGSYAEKVAQSVSILSDIVDDKLFQRVDIFGIGQEKSGYIQFRIDGKGLKVNEILIDTSARGHGLGTKSIIELMKVTNTEYLSETMLTEGGLALYKKLESMDIKIRWMDRYK